MKKHKTKFHEFNPQVYPFRLWVAIQPTITEVGRKFINILPRGEWRNFEDSDFDDNFGVVATVYPVGEKGTNQAGVLVCIQQPKKFGVGIIAHEAAHCADFFCENLGINTGSFYDGEPYAYIVGWVAECCANTMKPKKRKVKAK